MAEVEEDLDRRRRLRGQAAGRKNGSSGNGFDVRLDRLEERVDAMRETMRDTMATKADLQKMENNLIKWMIGMYVASGITLVVAVVRTLV